MIENPLPLRGYCSFLEAGDFVMAKSVMNYLVEKDVPQKDNKDICNR